MALAKWREPELKWTRSLTEGGPAVRHAREEEARVLKKLDEVLDELNSVRAAGRGLVEACYSAKEVFEAKMKERSRKD